MSQSKKNYAAEGGVRCPACLADGMEGRGFIPEFEGNGLITYKLKCGHCDSLWTETYQLTGFRSLVMPTEVKT